MHYQVISHAPCRTLFATSHRRMFILFLLCSSWLSGSSFAAGRNEVLIPVVALDGATSISPERVVAAIYTTMPPRVLIPGKAYNPQEHYPKVVFMLTDRGEAVWSADRLKGGPPYSLTRLPADRVSRLLDGLHAANTFTSSSLRRINYGPDAAFTTIFLRRGGESLEMASWHELYEQNPGCVATAHGLEAQNGRDRAAVLAAQPPDYRAFRAAWDAIKTKLFALLPKAGASPQPDPRIKVTGVAWLKLSEPDRH